MRLANYIGIMEIVTDPVNTPARLKGAVVALGNFDGVHRGHQVVLERARAIAKATHRPFGVMTFEPHPRSVFFPSPKPFRITPPSLKQRLLAEMGVDVLFEIPFSLEFAQHTAKYFAESLLAQQCAISHAVAGHDFVYGHNREGNIASLKKQLGECSVGVDEVSAQRDAGGQVWSSTRARECIEAGDMKNTAVILGRPWEIVGVVEHGAKRGAGIGFPTANVELNGYIRPRFGVYACHARVGDKTYKAVANVGTRPTVNGTAERLEVHIFGFSGDIYGQVLATQFIDFIRPEQRFDGLDALKAQISKDCIAAGQILA